MGKQSQLLLKPTEDELGLQVGVDFDKKIKNNSRNRNVNKSKVTSGAKDITNESVDVDETKSENPNSNSNYLTEARSVPAEHQQIYQASSLSMVFHWNTYFKKIPHNPDPITLCPATNTRKRFTTQ